MMRCPSCNGGGSSTAIGPCPRCKGFGYVYPPLADPPEWASPEAAPPSPQQEPRGRLISSGPAPYIQPKFVKHCPCGSVQSDECREQGCKWERNPDLVPLHMRPSPAPAPTDEQIKAFTDWWNAAPAQPVAEVSQGHESFGFRLLADTLPPDGTKLYAAPPPQTADARPVAHEIREDFEIDPTVVICPACCSQFRAIPPQVQQLLLAAGYEPPFTADAPPAAQTDERDAARWRFLRDNVLSFDSVADPDNLVRVWVGTDPSKSFAGRTADAAIDSAIAAKGTE